MAEAIRTTRRMVDRAVTTRRAEKRQELLDAALRVIRRDGPGVSMDRIGVEAGVTKPILYRHFGHKRGLYQAIAERYRTEMMRELHSALSWDLPPRELLRATLEAYFTFGERETPVFRFLSRTDTTGRPALEASIADFQAQVATEPTVVLREQLKPAGADTGAADPWAYALVGMARSVAEWWIDQPGMPRRHLLEYLTTLLWDGFAGVMENADSTNAPSI